MTIVIDNIRSGWNVGSIFRSCDAMGADLILVGYTARPLGGNLKVIAKTAIGAENTVNWQHFDHYNEVLEAYPNKLHFAIEINNKSQNIFEYLQNFEEDLDDVFLWFGNEIHGLSEKFCSETNKVLHLPMKGTKESLNISNSVTAAGYLFLNAKFIKANI